MKEGVILVAAFVVIVVGGLWITEHVSCFNFFGLAKGCVIGH